MNGRVYDPATAMFFSPDPFVQSPGDWSNYNRYSYVSNNPTRFIDPSGYVKGYFDTPVMDPGWTRISSTYFGGSGRINFDPYGFHKNDYYSDNKGNYFNWNGNTVPFGEVFNNYIDQASSSLKMSVNF